MRGKTLKQKQGGFKNPIKVRYLGLAVWLLASSFIIYHPTRATDCPDVKIIFARGSGGEQNTNADYLEFKSTIEEKLKTTTLHYEISDLDYPAVGVGFDNADLALTTLGALFSGGESYEFGDSMWQGVDNLTRIATDTVCPDTKYVLGGYSQGTMVVLNSLSAFDSEDIIYVATFGDPKIYLPEGEGILPAACRGDNLSDYRMYVPDCQAYKGILGAYIPYEPDAYKGKIGTWCNKRDALCSSHLNVNDHTRYIEEGLYEDASRVIFDKICRAFGIDNTISSPHDTAILIDATSSMYSLITEYKAEAKRLAEQTLAIGGRVALYDYRDYQEGYVPRQYCSFENCTIETFEAGLNKIAISGGGDTPESLLASSLHVMQELDWKNGSTKSIVVLTDAGYHEPDFDIGATTKLDVVRLSKQIDPVNFYVVTTPNMAEAYEELTSATGGRVVTTADDLSELTDYIVERYDTLPRVEEEYGEMVARPTLKIEEVNLGVNSAIVQFTTDGIRTMVILNDTILGVTSEHKITVSDLKMDKSNMLRLVPLGDDIKGEPVDIELSTAGYGADKSIQNYGKSDVYLTKQDVTNGFDWPFQTLKAPNTGRR